MIGVTSVAPLAGYRLRVGFKDGTEREIDVERFLRGPVFDAIRTNRSVCDRLEHGEVGPDLLNISFAAA